MSRAPRLQVERFTKKELLQGEKFVEAEAVQLDADLEYGLRSFGKGFTVLEDALFREEQARPIGGSQGFRAQGLMP